MNTTSERSKPPLLLSQMIAYVLLGIAIFRFWIMPLGSSLWGDEAGTFWSIVKGFRFIVPRSLEWPSVTPVYGFIEWAAWSLGKVPGLPLEYSLRWTSVAGIAVASALLYRLAKRLIGKESAFAAVAVFVCSQRVIFAATDARPYAIVLALAVGSTFALVRWLDTGANRYAFIYVVSAALVPEMQYLAASTLAVHLVYAIVRLREGSPVRGRSLAITSAVMLVLITPAVAAVLKLAGQGSTYSWAPRPLLPEVADLLVPSVLVFGGVLGVILVWFRDGLPVRREQIPFSAMCLPIVLALGPPLLFFLISNVSSNVIFVGRYLIASTVGLALLGGWLIGRLESGASRFVVTISAIVCSLISFGSIRHFWPEHARDNWRGAVETIGAVVSDQTPVLVQSGFIEADQSGHIPESLMAPLVAYPMRGHVIPLTNSFNEKSRAYLDANVLEELRSSPLFVLVNYEATDGYEMWMQDRLPDYSEKNMGDFGELKVMLFERRSGGTGTQ